MIFRDLKPDNVLIGEDGHLKRNIFNTCTFRYLFFFVFIFVSAVISVFVFEPKQADRRPQYASWPHFKEVLMHNHCVLNGLDEEHINQIILE